MSYHTPGKWMKQGQWATNKGMAECVEAEGWGIIGAWLDTSNEPHGNLDLIVAAPTILAALERLLACPDLNLDELELETCHAIQQAEDAVALVSDERCTR